MRRTLVVGLAVAAFTGPAAEAHSPIKATAPRAGATVAAAPRYVSIAFKASVLAGSLRVQNGAGRVVSVGKGRLVRQKALTVRLRSGLRSGPYTARARYVSSDGHARTYRWSFRVR